MITTLIHERRLAEDNSPWKDSPYHELPRLTIDGRGWIGEQICSAACKAANLTINEDVSNKSGKGKDIHYDIKVNNIFIEVKTSYRDKSNAWQHENIYKNCSNCDKVLFIDFD